MDTQSWRRDRSLRICGGTDADIAVLSDDVQSRLCTDAARVFAHSRPASTCLRSHQRSARSRNVEESHRRPVFPGRHVEGAYRGGKRIRDRQCRRRRQLVTAGLTYPRLPEEPEGRDLHAIQI
jgi:hypothetical protein